MRAGVHIIATLIAAAGAGALFAQSQPKDLQPLPDIPPPPKLSSSPTPDDETAPQVTIRQEGENKVEEFRAKGGRVYAIRVTPKVGKPYLLVDPDGKGTMTKAEDPGGAVRAPLWTILEF
jgi:Protein of unknown function (DUF2782)